MLDDIHRAFWVALRNSWAGWANRLIIVDPDTVVRWNRQRFRRHWTRISQRRGPGRPRTDQEIRELIRLMARDGWGAPQVHGELILATLPGAGRWREQAIVGQWRDR